MHRVADSELFCRVLITGACASGSPKTSCIPLLKTCRFAIALTRPRLATSYVAALLATGLIAGYWQAKVASAHAEAQLSARYVQVIDPYQMPHH